MASTNAVKHRWIGNHAEEISLGDKRVMVGPGDFVNLSKDDLEVDENKLWVESGLLIDATADNKEGGQ